MATYGVSVQDDIASNDFEVQRSESEYVYCYKIFW